jgi:beta-lactamase regulating signal transducer with metallopeptidase domain
MNDAIRAILVMSITGGTLAVILLALKPLVKNRLPQAAQYYMWLVVVAALLMPVSRFVTLPQADDSSPLALTPSAVTERFAVTAQEERVRVQAVIPQSGNNLAEKQAQSPISGAVSLFFALYPLGVAAVLLSYVVSYVWYLRRLRRSRVLTDIEAPVRVYTSDAAATPMLIGVFRPIIILPTRDYTDEQLRNVLAHELTHLRRGDVPVKWLSVVALALHWFNPLAWLTRREIDRLCELSCDEAVISRKGADERRSYGDTLIAVVAERGHANTALSTTMVESKQALKERLGAIMAHRKNTKLTLAVSAILIAAAALTACALGAGRANDDAATPEETVRLSIVADGGEVIYVSQVDGLPGAFEAGITLPTGKNAAYVYATYSLPDGIWTYDYILERENKNSEWEITAKYRSDLIQDPDATPAPTVQIAATVYVWGEGERPYDENVPATAYLRYAVFAGDPELTADDVYGAGEVFDNTSDVTSALAEIVDPSRHFVIQFLQMTEAVITKDELSAVAEAATRPFERFSFVCGLFTPTVTPTPDDALLSSWKPIEELPADYDGDKAAADGAYVNIQGALIYNQALADAFYRDVRSGGAAFLRAVVYTVEGDPIITDYQYDGEIFAVTTDTTRDKYGANEITSATYKYLVPLDRSRPQGVPMSYFLSNFENIYTTSDDGQGAQLIDGLAWVPSPTEVGDGEIYF